MQNYEKLSENQNLIGSIVYLRDIIGGICARGKMWSSFDLPILATIPRSGTWFLRYVISYLNHLHNGGRIDDRVTGRVIGRSNGIHFDYTRFKGGPLFRVKGLLPAEHLFIGHTACPGFRSLANRFEWWPDTSFHVPGYDYLHDGHDYRYTPVDLADYEYAPIYPNRLEARAAAGRGQRAALVFRNPIGQALSYFRYCQASDSEKYNTLVGRPLAKVPFREFLFEHALLSYAKQFVSYQAMAERHSDSVLLIPYERLMNAPAETLASLLNHLSGRPRADWPNLLEAVWLARYENMKAIEVELDRSLDRTRKGSHMTHSELDSAGADDSLRAEAIQRLEKMNVNTSFIEWATPISSKRVD